MDLDAGTDYGQADGADEAGFDVDSGDSVFDEAGDPTAVGDESVVDDGASAFGGSAEGASESAFGGPDPSHPTFGSHGYRYEIPGKVSPDGNPVVGDTAGRLYDPITGEELSPY